MMRKMLSGLLTVVILGTLLAGCSQPTPEIITKIETVVVEKEKVVEKQVVSTVVVEKPVQQTVVVEKEKIVEKLVTPTPEPPKLSGEQVLRLTGSCTGCSLDPGLQSHLLWQDYALYEGLTRLDENAQAVPGLAESWEVSADGLVYTFHIRPNAKFSNGDPVTAQDFVWTWTRNLDPNRPGNSYDFVLTPIKGATAWMTGAGKAEDLGVKALDDHTLQVTLEAPFAPFPNLMAMPMSAPLHRKTLEAHPDDWTTPQYWVSAGPWILEDFVEKSHLYLKPNPHYYAPDRPYLKKVEFLMGGASLLAYENDEIDIGDPGGEIDRVRRDPVLSKQLVEKVRSSEVFWYINHWAPGMEDVRVRRAFALAIDRYTLCKTVANDLCVPNGGYLPTTMPMRADELDYGYDPALAKQLMAEAGYPDGKGFPTVTLLTRGEGWPEFLKDQWETNLGVSVLIERVEAGVFVQRRWSFDNPVQFIAQSWSSSYNDPAQWLADGIFSFNPSYRTIPVYSMTLEKRKQFADMQAAVDAEKDAAKKTQMVLDLNNWIRENTVDWAKEYDRVVEQSRVTADPTKRAELIHEAQKILIDNVFAIPLASPKAAILVKPWVKGLIFNGLQPNIPMYYDTAYIQK